MSPMHSADMEILARCKGDKYTDCLESRTAALLLTLRGGIVYESNYG